ncbi:MAG: sugar ABC transporter permease [Dehalococcoidales bacterium]|nr:sugar ABC transporter permease [Dehalococcoidales bacterium]
MRPAQGSFGREEESSSRPNQLSAESAGTAVAQQPSAAGKGGLQSKTDMTYIWMLLPAVTLLLLIVAAPLVILFRNSLYHLEFSKPWLTGFVGLENYQLIVDDSRFFESIWRAFIFIAESVVIELVIALFLAELLSVRIRGISLFKSLLLLPMVLPPIVVGIMWRIIYHPTLGILNYLLSFVGLGPAWLADPGLALHALVITDVWQWTPFLLLMFMAGYAAVPQELYEAAQVDGASRWHRFRFVTLPLLRPLIVIGVLFRTVDGMKVFPTIHIMTEGGPGNASEVMNYYAYKVAFAYTNIGYSSALSFIMFLIAIVISIGMIRAARGMGAQL